MFGNLIQAFKGGGMGGKATHVLRKTYNLSISHPDHLEIMKNISQNFSQSYDEHEMAVQFLAQFSKTIKKDHPQAKREIEKYIRMSKGAYNRGLLKSDIGMKELFNVAKERFNIDSNDIDAA